MEGIIQELIKYIVTDSGREGMIALMMVITVGALYMMERKDREFKKDSKELIEQFQKQSEENRKDLMIIIDKYQEGQISVVQAINEIKLLLATIGSKL